MGWAAGRGLASGQLLLQSFHLRGHVAVFTGVVKGVPTSEDQRSGVARGSARSSLSNAACGARSSVLAPGASTS